MGAELFLAQTEMVFWSCTKKLQAVQAATNCFCRDRRTNLCLPKTGPWMGGSLYTAWVGTINNDLDILPLEGDRKPFPFLQTQFNESHARFSPDVKWIAYVSDESGRAEVYVQSFPASGGKWQISAGGGDQPQWRRDGKELFYLSPDRKIMAVQAETSTAFPGPMPTPRIQTGVNPTTSTNARNNYVVAADGQRFLVNNIVPESASKPITVILNWTAQLKK